MASIFLDHFLPVLSNTVAKQTIKNKHLDKYLFISTIVKELYYFILPLKY